MTDSQDQSMHMEDDGRLFIGGLSWETTKERLQEYFSKFGEVISCEVMVKPDTGKSRGFGFVTFKDIDCIGKVLSSGPHEVDGRIVDPKIFSPQKINKSVTYPKVFLGGLPPNCTETDIRSFFSRYGSVIKVDLKYDHQKKKPKGFGFLSFETEDSVRAVCAERFVKINGKQVEVKHMENWNANASSSSGSSNTPSIPLSALVCPRCGFRPLVPCSEGKWGYGLGWGGPGYGAYGGPGYEGNARGGQDKQDNFRRSGKSRDHRENGSTRSLSYGGGYTAPPTPGSSSHPSTDGYAEPDALSQVGRKPNAIPRPGVPRDVHGYGAASSWAGPSMGQSGGYCPDPYRSPDGSVPRHPIDRAGIQGYHPYKR